MNGEGESDETKFDTSGACFIKFVNYLCKYLLNCYGDVE